MLKRVLEEEDTVYRPLPATVLLLALLWIEIGPAVASTQNGERSLASAFVPASVPPPILDNP
jgi:hypothetical protein